MLRDSVIAAAVLVAAFRNPLRELFPIRAPYKHPTNEDLFVGTPNIKTDIEILPAAS
jgi:hypothetical protein